MIKIREQTEADKDQIWEIIKSVISRGDTYYFAPDSSKEKMLEIWFGKEKNGFVATISEHTLSTVENAPDLKSANLTGEKIVGIFFITRNFPDLASHIANAGYMVAPEARGLGIGKMMAEFSIDEAKRLGFKAMQFNFVVKSNSAAIKLWEKLGFQIIGEIPDAFQHPPLGFTNVYIMFRKL